ncbi:MAG: glutamate-1-semialdehyde 2,1-aminomutase [Deferribacterales bacterium]
MNIFEESKKFIPGGVNSPVRAYGSVGGDPVIVKSAKGSKIYSEDGKEYIDYIGSWGPMITGHADDDIINAVKHAAELGTSFGAPTKAELDIAKLICEMVPSVEMVRLVSSGTEALMSAIRLARAYTRRDKIIKFEGCYHGHSDSLLVKSGSGLLTFNEPSSPGVPEDFAKHTLIAQYNDIESVKKLISENKGQIACLLVEPVAGNMGLVLPKDGFLADLRKACDSDGILLLLDEVITGFRIAKGGAQEYYGVMPDITTMGKIIGGGLPVGAFGGRRDLMQMMSPVGPVYQAGTLSGNPLATAAGITMLTKLSQPDFYKNLKAKADILYDAMADNSKKLGLNYAFNRVESLACLFFTEGRVESFQDAMKSDTKKYAKFFHEMLNRGVNLAPSQFEAMFVSSAHTEEDLEKTAKAHYESLKAL